MPISMLDRSAYGTSLVTNSHSRIAKLHMSADRRLISSGFFCRAGNHIGESEVRVTQSKHTELHNNSIFYIKCFYTSTAEHKFAYQMY